ncbi:hypothetical protein BDL97_04G068900 [Sphagnum fallax]|nr:hypothetical protein BDL97_04G068900 [Sphagnum fallax]
MGKPAVVARPVDRLVVQQQRARGIAQAPPPQRVENQVVLAPILKKKKPGAKLWMRFDAAGNSEVLECDRNAILQRVSIPARDLRILGPVFSQSSHILARENAMVVNLEYIRTIITAEEVYLLDPNNPNVVPFAEKLQQQLLLQNQIEKEGGMQAMVSEGLPEQLPFEFRVLEIALDVVCHYLETKVWELEHKARPALDQLTKMISTSNLELVRSVKSQLTRLTAHVQKVRDELVQLLDDDENMADLYLTRKLQQTQHMDSPLVTIISDDGGTASSIVSRKLFRLASLKGHGHSRRSTATHTVNSGLDVDELEMLLEAYFMQVDSSLNKLSLVREYISDTEDYINIQLDYQRNQLFQFQIMLGASALSLAMGMAIVGPLSMNIPIPIYDNNNWFTPFVCSMVVVCISIFFSVIGYVRWKGLFE